MCTSPFFECMLRVWVWMCVWVHFSRLPVLWSIPTCSRPSKSWARAGRNSATSSSRSRFVVYLYLIRWKLILLHSSRFAGARGDCGDCRFSGGAWPYRWWLWRLFQGRIREVRCWYQGRYLISNVRGSNNIFVNFHCLGSHRRICRLPLCRVRLQVHLFSRRSRHFEDGQDCLPSAVRSLDLWAVTCFFLTS